MNDKSFDELKEDLKSIENKVKELDFDKNNVIDSIKNESTKWFKKWFKIIFGSLSVIGVLSIVIMWFQIYKTVRNKSETYITDLITVQFSEENIKQTLIGVANDKAKDIIVQEVKPAVDSVKNEINTFKTYLDESGKDISLKYDNLNSEIDMLKKRNEFMQLADKAITSGDRESYDLLKEKMEELKDTLLFPALLSELLRAKSFYVGGTRLTNVSITHKKSDGTILKDEEIDTVVLIDDLHNNNNWLVRARAAQILGNRKEINTPGAMIEAMEKDKRLDVVKICIDSFEKLTGYKNNDILEYNLLTKWWEENKEEYISNLQTKE